MRKLKTKYGSRIICKVIGDGNYRNEELGIVGLAWNKEDELKELSSFDIGIMPIPDDDWAKGKCGLKGLQYMALEIATVMSPVGVNSAIIQDGENGFLVERGNAHQLAQAILVLLEDQGLRESMGLKSRAKAEKEYSIQQVVEKTFAIYEGT